jgi:hypothetical protein
MWLHTEAAYRKEEMDYLKDRFRPCYVVQDPVRFCVDPFDQTLLLVYSPPLSLLPAPTAVPIKSAPLNSRPSLALRTEAASVAREAKALSLLMSKPRP